jgi:hypothetical protein
VGVGRLAERQRGTGTFLYFLMPPELTLRIASQKKKKRKKKKKKKKILKVPCF